MSKYSATSVVPDNPLPFWGLMFFTFVLFATPQGWSPIFYYLYLGKLSAGFALAVYVLDCLSKGKSLTVNTPVVRLILYWLVLAVLSIPFSRWPGGSLNSLVDPFLKAVLVFILIANTVTTVRRMKLMIGSMVLWGVFVAWTGVGQYFSLLPGGRIFGYRSPLAMNPNDLALTLSVLLALTFGLHLAATTASGKFLLLGAMGLMIGGIIASYSRGGFLSMMMILMAIGVNRYKERGPAVLAGVVVLLTLLLIISPASYMDRLHSIINISEDPKASATRRWDMMVLAWNSMLSHPLLGVGLGVHGLDFLDQLSSWNWKEVHNVYLQIGADLGIPALLVYLFANWKIFTGMREALNKVKKSPGASTDFALGTGINIAFIGYAVGAFFHPVAYHFYFFYIAGFAVAFQEITKHVSEQTKGDSQQNDALVRSHG